MTWECGVYGVGNNFDQKSNCWYIVIVLREGP